MGADKPEEKKVSAKPSIPLSLILIGVATCVIFVAVFKSLDFISALDYPNLSPKEESKLQKRLKEIDDSEQYALVAKMDGWYPCLHSGKSICYLLAGEVWKYGVTSKGEFGRYTSMFMGRNNVSYIIEFKGNIAECLKQEQIKLFNYPFLPENLVRSPEERLPRPPYNPIMR